MWRRSDHLAAHTNGSRTSVDLPGGVQRRLSDELPLPGEGSGSAREPSASKAATARVSPVWSLPPWTDIMAVLPPDPALPPIDWVRLSAITGVANLLGTVVLITQGFARRQIPAIILAITGGLFLLGGIYTCTTQPPL